MIIQRQLGQFSVHCTLYTPSTLSVSLSLSMNQGMQAQVHDWDAANVSWQAVGSHPGRQAVAEAVNHQQQLTAG